MPRLLEFCDLSLVRGDGAGKPRFGFCPIWGSCGPWSQSESYAQDFVIEGSGGNFYLRHLSDIEAQECFSHGRGY